MIRVPLNLEGKVDVEELHRRIAAEAGAELPTIATPTPEDIAAYHRERAEIELAIGMDHLRRAAKHMAMIAA